jgi:hypothetical protein
MMMLCVQKFKSKTSPFMNLRCPMLAIIMGVHKSQIYDGDDGDDGDDGMEENPSTVAMTRERLARMQ